MAAEKEKKKKKNLYVKHRKWTHYLALVITQGQSLVLFAFNITWSCWHQHKKTKKAVQKECALKSFTITS
jgi:hypothetical protein